MKKKIVVMALVASACFGLTQNNKAKAVKPQPFYVHLNSAGCTECILSTKTVICNRDTYVPICN